MLPSIAELYGRSGVGLGESPFGIKGFGYTQHHEWVEANLPGGLSAQWAAMGRYADDPFFRQTFYASTFYDIFPLILLGHACASVAGVTSRDFVRERARSQAEQDLRYIRKWLVKLASPVQVARRLPSVATAYFNFGHAEAPVPDQAPREREPEAGAGPGDQHRRAPRVITRGSHPGHLRPSLSAARVAGYRYR